MGIGHYEIPLVLLILTSGEGIARGGRAMTYHRASRAHGGDRVTTRCDRCDVMLKEKEGVIFEFVHICDFVNIAEGIRKDKYQTFRFLLNSVNNRLIEGP